MMRKSGISRSGFGCVARGCALAPLWLLALWAVGAAQTPPPAPASPPSPSQHQPAPRSSLPGVSNFAQVTPTLYRGAQPSKEGFSSLAHAGVNIVVDLRGSRESERRIVTGLGMRYVAIPWRCYRPHDQPIARFLALLRDNPGKKVFVHCRVGDDRTGMDIAAYRMAEQGWTAEEARREMDLYGVNWFHRTICPGLASYEKEFPERFHSDPAFRDLRSGQQPPLPR